MKLSLAATLFLTAGFAYAGGCGGSGGGGGFGCWGGDSSYRLELPKVEEEVAVAGFNLKVDCVKWGITIFDGERKGAFGIFQGEDLKIQILNVSALGSSPEECAQALAGPEQILVRRKISTSGAVRGFKAVYGQRRPPFQQVRKMAWFFKNAGGETICFLATPAKNYPDWSEANALVLDKLRLSS